MSKLGAVFKHIISNGLAIFVLGEVGNIEEKRGVKEKHTPAQERRFRRSAKLVTKANLWLLKISNGRLGNSFLGRPILLLTTIGRKSGQPRTQPVFFMRDDRRIVLVASNGGNTRNPVWLLNATANPRVSIKLNGKSQNMTFRVASEEEKARLWPRLTEMFGSSRER